MFAVLLLVLFLDGLDVSMVGIAQPPIGYDLGPATDSLRWITNGYVLGYGGLMLLGGRTADLLGRRQVFLAAPGVFAAASLLGGLIDDSALLIAIRFVRDAVGALTLTAGYCSPCTPAARGCTRPISRCSGR